jgi:dTMP kinase
VASGKLITFEGIDGSGKSTQARLLCEHLRKEGLAVSLFREPGGTVTGEAVREKLLHQLSEMEPEAETLLFGSARHALVEERIRPALMAGEIVILDRYIDSTIAYQGYGRGVNLDFIDDVNENATKGLLPDLTFLIDIDPVVALSRHQRIHDRMEREGVEFMQRVRQGYIHLAGSFPNRIRVFDGTKPMEEIEMAIRKDVTKLLEGRIVSRGDL